MLDCRLFLLVGSPGLHVALRQPPAGIDQLHHVDKLLEQHDGRRDAGNHPRPVAIDFVGARQLERTGAPGAGEEAGRRRVRWVPGLGRGRLGVGDGLQ